MNPLDQLGDMNPEQKAQLQKLLQKQQAMVNQQNAVAEQAAQMPAQADYSSLASLADAWGAGGVAKGYKAPQSVPEKQALIATLREKALAGQQNVTKDMLTSVLGQDKTSAMLMRMIASQNNTNTKSDRQQADRIDKMAKDLGKSVDFNTGARGTKALLSRTALTGAKLQTLLEQYKQDPNAMPPKQINELAQGVAALITGTGTVGIEQIRQVVPESAAKDWADVVGYFKNQPTGAQAKAFLANLGDTIHREVGTATNAMNEIRHHVMPVHSQFYEESPDRFKQIMAAYGIPPEEVDQAFQSSPEELAKGFKGEIPVPNMGETKTVHPYKGETQYQNGHEYRWNKEKGLYE